MAISSRIPEVDRPVKALGRIGGERAILPLGHVTGRLTPLALDNAQRKQDALLYSVAVGGLTRDQIASVDLLSLLTLGWFRAAMATLISRARPGA